MTYTAESFTGVILAGGRNSRMGERNKALLSVNGVRIIDRQIEVFRRFFEDVIVVTNNPSDYYDTDARIVTDIYDVACPLAGIHSALFHSQTEWIFAIPCDVPFISGDVIQLITASIRPQFSVVLPKTEAGYEPLCAAYSKKNLSRIETSLESGDYKILNFFKKKQVRLISEKKLREIDPGLTFFFNINTPEDLETAERLKVKGR